VHMARIESITRKENKGKHNRRTDRGSIWGSHSWREKTRTWGFLCPSRQVLAISTQSRPSAWLLNR
jgi:hypothetical protein